MRGKLDLLISSEISSFSLFFFALKVSSMEWWITSFFHVAGVLSATYFYSFISSYNHSTVDNNNTVTTLVINIPTLPMDVKMIHLLSLAISTVYLLYLLRTIYTVIFGTVAIVNTPTGRDVGYLMTPGRTKKDIANMVRQRRRVGDIPPPYPNGWYEIMRSADLASGTSKAVSLVGHHFAVFRRANGHVAIMDAYCPHLGANLGVGGIVRGNCIECPFHGWQFDGDTGQCMSIPYAEKVPSFAKTKVWPSLEINEIIFVWYDAEGREPWFHPEDLLASNSNWTYKGYTHHLINAHCQDLSENGADVSHLKTVHEVGVQSGNAVNYKSKPLLGKLLVHDWKVNWEPLPDPNGHVGRMSISLTNKLFGKWPIKFLDTKVIADQIGPSIVHLKFNLFFGNGFLVHTTVPEEPLLQRMTHYMYCDWWIPAFFAKWLLLRGEAIQIERDAIIWDNKTYASKPLLVKEDGLILAHRRWFSQFYSKSSVKVNSSVMMGNDLQW